METKQIEVTCPCCSHVLTVDVLTQQVLRSAPPTQRDETGKVVLDEGRWDEARERVRERSEGAPDRMEEALSRERARDTDMDELFEKARRKALGGEAPAEPEDPEPR